MRAWRAPKSSAVRRRSGIASLRLDAAETVRRAARQVRSTAERVDAARAGAALAEQRFDDEQRRYEVGLSTTFLVTQAQRDLLQAQVKLLQTTLDYQSAVVNFEAVQQAPPAGAGETSASAAPTSSCCRRRRRAGSSAPARGSEARRWPRRFTTPSCGEVSCVAGRDDGAAPVRRHRVPATAGASWATCTAAGLADLPFPLLVRDELVAAGRARGASHPSGVGLGELLPCARRPTSPASWRCSA